MKLPQRKWKKEQKNRAQQEKQQSENIYALDQKARAKIALKGVLVISILSYLFFEDLYGMILLIPYWFFYCKRESKNIIEQKKQQLKIQFKELLAGMSSALVAGYSVENSITEARASLQCMYHEETILIRQVKKMENQIRMNETIEGVFFQFANQAQIEEIQNFAWILVTAKRTGGDLIKITSHTSDIINQKIDVDREIQTSLAAKRYESNIMNLIPLGILVYLKVCSPGFLDPLYQDIRGHVVMAVILLFYLGALQLSRAMMEIRI